MFRRVLVVLSGPPVSERILPWVRRLLAPIGGEIRLLSVLRPPAAVVAGARTLAYASQREDSVRLAAALRLETLAAGLRDDGLVVTADVRFGEPVAAALDAVHEWGAEMIAVADAPPRGWHRLEASVVEAMLQRSPVPVLASLSSGHRAA
jgi:nucleotide-binding universal stress UspA family protein